MSISRFNVKIGSKGNATPHHSYICGIEQYANKTGVMFNMSGNMPDWAKDDPARFWRAADEFERANGSTYKEHTLSLPRELTLEQQQRVVNEWVKQELGDKHPYTFAIHHTKAQDGGLNPHAHLMYSQRTHDGIKRDETLFFKRANKKFPERGGCVKAETNMTKTQMRAQLVAQRNRWGEHLRECLREFGHYDLANQVDMRNWKERGLDEPPTNKTMAEIQLEKKLDNVIENHPYYLSLEPPAPKPKPQPKPEPPPPPPVVSLQITASYIPDGHREPYQRPTVAIGSYRDYRGFQSGYVRFGQVDIDLGTMQIKWENITERYPDKFKDEFIEKMEKHATMFLTDPNAYNEHLQRTHGAKFQTHHSFHKDLETAFEYLGATHVPPEPQNANTRENTRDNDDFGLGM